MNDSLDLVPFRTHTLFARETCLSGSGRSSGLPGSPDVCGDPCIPEGLFRNIKGESITAIVEFKRTRAASAAVIVYGGPRCWRGGRALGIGEALVSFLDEEGRPQVVQQAFILPPQSLMSEADADERARLIRPAAAAQRDENG